MKEICGNLKKIANWYKDAPNKMELFYSWINIDDVEYKWSGTTLLYREPGKSMSKYEFVFSGDPEEFVEYSESL